MAVPMRKDVIERFLTAVPLFADLSAAELEMLSSGARSLTFKKGARIFEEGTAADCCYVLTAGRARVLLAGAGGTETLLHIVIPPALVGEIALLDKSNRSASLVAAEACQLIRIPATALETLRTNAAFERRLVAALVAIVRESDDRLRVISSFPSVNRVAWCLGRIARYAGHRNGAAIVIPRMSQNDLGEMAGCTRETVSRALQTLRRKKFLSWDSETMRLDVEGMQRYLTSELTVPPPADRPPPQL